MIKRNIQKAFIHQYNLIVNFADNIFVADYTEQTKSLPTKRNVEFFSPNPPIDINCFEIINSPNLPIDGIEFNNSSFVYGNGNPKSQCEAVIYPSTSDDKSWILFCELKYSSKPLNNNSNMRKAIKQLFKTRYYYIQEGVISKSNNSYLIASLPLQSEPFANFSIPPALLTKLKRKKNIVLRMKNSVEIIDDVLISI